MNGASLTGDVMFYYDRDSRASNVARELLGVYKGNVQTGGNAGQSTRTIKATLHAFLCQFSAHAPRQD